MDLNEKDMKRFKKIKKFFIINTVLLLPCSYLTVFKFIYTDPNIQNEIWTHSFLELTIPIVFLRCFFIPYIASVILSIYYFVFLIKTKFLKKDFIMFIVLFTLTILGLLSLEEVFLAGMSI